MSMLEMSGVDSLMWIFVLLRRASPGSPVPSEVRTDCRDQ